VSPFGCVRKSDGFVSIVQDITDRKRAEARLAERNAQFDLAGKIAGIGSYAYDAGTEIMQISDGYAAIHGFAEGTTEIARSECLAGVHPDDLGRVEQFRSEAFRERRREYNVEYRIIRPGGELRWVETRCFISFSGAGHPTCISANRRSPNLTLATDHSESGLLRHARTSGRELRRSLCAARWDASLRNVLDRGVAVFTADRPVAVCWHGQRRFRAHAEHRSTQPLGWWRPLGSSRRR
jgi:PAS fold